MRKLLNRLLAPAGYRIEKITRFERLTQALVQRGRPFRFVQIGANDGVRFDDLFNLVTQHACHGVVVEPLPDMFERLELNYADYPHIIAINTAIHETATALPLFRLDHAAAARYPGWASGIASFDREHLIRHSIAPADIGTYSTPCVPLMNLLESTQMLDVDLLQVDTEGYDAQIVRMIDFARCRPGIIKFEHKNIAADERSALTQHLAANGYRTEVEWPDTIAWREAAVEHQK